MQLNHHILAKRATDAILANFKNGDWTCCGQYGREFYRTCCSADFPSPDAAFFDATHKISVAFEFKPPTETKRGILTGLGQAIAYLQFSNLSYLIVPEFVESFGIAAYMCNVYSALIERRLPLGLISYRNDNPSDVRLLHNISQPGLGASMQADDQGGSFWAKHLDMPIPLFHLILHYLYQKRVCHRSDDAFAQCWIERMVSLEHLRKLEYSPVRDVNNDVIKTLTGCKDLLYFESKIKKSRQLSAKEQKEQVKKLIADAKVGGARDNMYSSVRKNCLNFMRHVGVIDSNIGLTDQGFKMYHLGLVHGPNSIIFRDYFARMVLIDGHHIDLIYDLDKLLCDGRGGMPYRQAKKVMLQDYSSKGMIKVNPNRSVSGNSSTQVSKFLGHEMTLWRSLGLIRSSTKDPSVVFNWNRITEVCNLPDL